MSGILGCCRDALTNLSGRCVVGELVGAVDYLAIVIFYPDYSVKGAVLVPYSRVWPIVDSRKYRRISYGEACQLDEAVDISELVSAAAQQ